VTHKVRCDWLNTYWLAD